MSDWEDDDLEAWSEGRDRGPSRLGLVLVAVVVLFPFVMLVGGGANAVDALGPGLIAVAVFFVAVALTFLLVRRWLRRRMLGAPRSPSTPGGSRWSDRR